MHVEPTNVYALMSGGFARLLKYRRVQVGLLTRCSPASRSHAGF